MENSTASAVQSLNASGSSRVHVGNSYNITHNHGTGSEEDGAKKYLDALRSTNPRDDKARIEQTNGGLLKDSYVWILESPEFIAWREKSKTGRLLWIRGDPGKGKTMLLCGLVNELQPLTRLDGSDNEKTISYFFCQATNSGLNNYTAVLKGLIYLLVIQHPAAVSHLDHKEDKDHWNYKVSLEATFRKILDDPGLGETYLLVDALDECIEDLPLLLALISSTSSRAKWIATSRNRCEIQELFEEASSKLAVSLELHEGSVSRAVDSYIDYRTRQLAERKRLKKSSLQKIHDHLSENAHGTFLWVALVCQRLERCRAWEIPNQLSQFPQGLNQLYAKMMDQIRKSDSCALYIRLLAVASTVFRPLTFAELIAMEDLQIDEDTVPDLIVECGSFLTTKKDSVVFIHQSAKDFLLKESSTLLFQSGLAQHQYDLFQRCIAMLQNLHQDIYGLVHPGVSLNEALRNCPNPDPLENIKYPCAFWADHMQEAYKLSIRGDEYSDIPGVDIVHDFINEKFLFWLEALALCQSIPAALKALVFLRDLPLPGQGSYRVLVEEALRFSHYFCPIIESHPLQIYASGLLFSPHDSLIRRRFKQHTSKIFLEGPRISHKWSPIRRIYECPGKDLDIKTMIFSPTSQTLVVSTSSTLTRWHLSQESVPDVIERENSHNRIALSSDGNWLAIIVSRPGSEIAEPSAPCELQVHDLGLSRIAWRQKLDSSEILGMTISPNSQDLLVCYESLLVVYDSSGRIRRLYPLENTLPRLFHKPENEEIYFSFSSDCSWVAFHMRHWTQIWVLNLKTGKQYMNTPQNDTVHIRDVKFIPGTYSLMFCDFVDNIYLWNVIEQKCEFWSLIQYSFSRLAVSHSDSWMVLCGDNGLIICDRALRSVKGFFDLPDLQDLQEIAISFDDQIIACGTEGGLWILDANTVLAEAARHRAYEKVLAFNNGRLIAYNFGHQIEVWDAATGCILNSLVFDDIIDPNRTIEFSPSDRYLLVGGPQWILGWDLTGRSWQKITGDFDGGPIAVSDKRRNGDRWVAACRSIREVSVWNISAEQWIRDLRQPESQDWEVASIGFAGSQLGALWCPRGLSWGDSLFLLFNLRTGEQVSRIEISPRQTIENRKLLHLRKARLKLSSSGTFVMIQPCPQFSSFLWNLSSDGDCIEVCNKFQNFYFLDDLTVSTDEGMFRIGSIQSNSSQPSEKVPEVRVGMNKEDQNRPSRIYMAYSKYSKGLNGEWINFDNRPLLWRPAPYREEIIAIGHDYIILHINNSVDFIRFAKDADRVLCQAMRNLS